MSFNIPDDFYTANIPAEARVIYFKEGGNNTNDGTSLGRAVQTVSQAITLASAMSPAPSLSNPVIITTDGGGILPDNFTLPDYVSLNAPDYFFEGVTASPTIGMGTGSFARVRGITNNVAGGVALDFNGGQLSSVNCYSIVANGDTSSVAVQHRGAAAFNRINCEDIVSKGKCISNTSTATEEFTVDCDVIAANGNGATLIYNNALCELGVQCDRVNDESYTTVTALDNVSGTAGLSCLTIQAATAITNSGVAGTTLVHCGSVAGDITVSSGTTLITEITSHPSGTVTNSGTIDGYISGTYYGTFVTGNLLNTVVVESKSDLPAPAAGVITLADDTRYLQSPFTTVALGTDRIEIPNSSSYDGASNCILSYTGTGAMFTVSGTNEVFTAQNMTFLCTSGTFIEESGSGNFIQLQDFAAYCATIASTFAPSAGFRQVNFLYSGFTAGMNITGTNATFYSDTGTFAPASGTLTCIDFNSATFDLVTIHNNGFTFASSGNTGIDGAASSANINSGGWGVIRDSRFSGAAGTPIATITESDARWRMYGLLGAPSTVKTALLYITAANEAATVISGTGAGNEVVIAGTWTEDSANLMTTTTGGRVTWDAIESGVLDIAFQCRVDPASGSNKDYSLHVKKNGSTVRAASRATVQASAGSPVNVTVFDQVPMDETDYIEIVIQNDTDTVNVTCKSPNLRVSAQ